MYDSIAIIRGLRPAIRLHVLQTNPTNMEELQSSAAIAEASLSATGMTDDVAKLTAQVAQLVDKMNKQVTIAAINSPREERRRVSFKADESSSDRPRSPSPYRSSGVGEYRRRYRTRVVRHQPGNFFVIFNLLATPPSACRFDVLFILINNTAVRIIF